MERQSRTLEPNMRGDDVKQLQEDLRRLGFEADGQEGFFGATTFQAVTAFQKQHDLPSTGLVDGQTARVMGAALDAQPREGYLARGQVARADGSPVAFAMIEVLEKRLRSEHVLGQGYADAQGRFEVDYPQPETTPLSIVVRATGRDGDEKAISDLICDAGPVNDVTLTAGGEARRGPSEYAQLDDALRPALAAEQLDPADLTDDDVEFLACKFGLEAEHVALFVTSARHHRETDILAEAYYGLMRQGLPTELSTLVAQSSEVLRDALVEAMERNIINPQSEAAIASLVQALENQIVPLSLREPAPDRPTFATLLSIAGVETEQRPRILEGYVKRKGTVEEYWRELRASPDIRDSELDELQDTLKLSTVALNHVDLVTHLTHLRRTGAIGPQLRDLGQIRPAQWREFLETEVEGQKIGAPTFFGEDETERINRYAEFLPRMVEHLFPTAVLTHRLEEMDDSEVDFQPAIAFLKRNPDFEFRDTPVQVYLDEHPDALADVQDAEETVGGLKRMQRLFEIALGANKARVIAGLMAKGIDSAVAIRRMGPTQFIRQHKHILGLGGAQEVYDKAARKADTVLWILSQSKVFNPTNPAIVAPHLVGPGVPELEELFGSLDLCACEHCNSVYSPAAYLVDILHYLMNRPAVSGGRTALDVLFDRRPDLGEIELNCHNTNTMLPYVDLVLEMLEAAVVSGGTLPPLPFQTTGEAEALGANPEHLNEQAYDIVRQAHYPWLLPFDLWLAEVRTYLNHMGVPFYELMRQFQFDDTPEANAAVAAEYLDLSARERELITGSGSDPLYSLWGFDEAGDLNLFVEHRQASQLLDRTGLTYDELTDLLEVRYIDPNGNLEIQFDGADCDLDAAIVANLNTSALERIHRFVRLWRRQPWSIADLGVVLDTLGANDLNDTLLEQLAAVTALQRELNTPLPILLNWLSDRLATDAHRDQPALYDRLFLDPTVHNPALAIFALNGARTELAELGALLQDHVPITYSALGISAADLGHLMEAELSEFPNLNLANLTRLYQAVSLSKALKLSISDYVALRELSGIDPFGAGAIEPLQRFVELAQRVRRTPFTMSQLNYLLRHDVTETSPIGPSEAEVTAHLVNLRAGLHQIALENRVPNSGDAILRLTEQKLALMLSADDVSQLWAILNQTSTQSFEDQKSVLQASLETFMDPSEVIDAWFGESAGARDEPAAMAAMILTPLLDVLARRAGEQLVVQTLASAQSLDPLLVETLLRRFVTIPGSEAPALDAFFADDFTLASRVGAESPDFQATTNSTHFPNPYAVYERLAKAALILSTINMPMAGLGFFFTAIAEADGLDLNALPVEPVESPSLELDRVLAAADLLQEADRLFGDPASLFDLLRLLDHGPIERQAFLQAIASQSGQDVDDLAYLTGPSALDLAFPADFRNGQFLATLKSCFDMLHQLPVAATTLHQWATQPVEAATARAVKQTARARYEDKAQWLTVAKPLRDELRAQQRATLVSYLVHTIRIQVPRFEEPQPMLMIGAKRPAVQELQLKLNMAGATPPLKVDGWFGIKTRQALIAFKTARGLGNQAWVAADDWAVLNQINRRLQGPNELYAHFLVDVEMDPCMLTSRIVLAHSSIQLFVQRCLLNLEPKVELSPEDAKEWEWMKRYRVWEANRKVFLYPGNWVYPELRDDKTPLFKALESGLLQSEMNEATIEREYLNYLNGLNQIAQLEISGLYRQWEKDKDILHLFGRTPNTPHLYYYRRWVEQSYWTPWERVDVDIEGSHLVPVVWNQRLYLFWPMLMQRSVEINVQGNDTPPPPKQYYDIHMAWSEYRDGQWSPGTISNTFISTTPTWSLEPESEFQFWPQFDHQNRLYIVAMSKTMTVPKMAQFRFEACEGELVSTALVKINSASAWRPFPPVSRQRRPRFPGTDYHFDALVEKTGEYHPLKVFTSGDTFEMGDISYFINRTSALVLHKTPGNFRVVLPSTDRHFQSRSPFVYADQKRTFIVVPRGKHINEDSGGIGELLDKQVAVAQQPVPLEFPDVVTHAVARALDDFKPIWAKAAPDVHDDLTQDLGNGLAPMAAKPATTALWDWKATNFRFESHYHPFVCLLIEELRRYGIDGVLKPDPEKEKNQQRKAVVQSLKRQQRDRGFFKGVYGPNSDVVDDPLPREGFDFEPGGSYSVYNQEAFFHAPRLLAKRLSDNQRFAEAKQWLEYIFDPTYRPENPLDEPWPERVWQIKPFFEHGVGQSIQRTMLLLKSSGLTQTERETRKQLRDQIDAWREDPFNPHLIARMRPDAYMKATVMDYLDNLIAWGDQCFRQNTMESINEATQLYVLAAEILGERPREIEAHENATPTINGEEVRTFNDLQGRLDAFSNVLVELETLIEPEPAPKRGGWLGSLAEAAFVYGAVQNGNGALKADFSLAAKQVEPEDNPFLRKSPLAKPIPVVLGPTLFFCIPKNDKLLGYWDTVGDRLFKIRHCMTIDGVVRQLPLFQPPIDPALLVKAAAAGLDMGSVVNDLNVPLSPYRFSVLIQKAHEFVGDVKSLGAALLAALEKEDAEALSLLRSSHEIMLLERIRDTRQQQITEAQKHRDALLKTREVVEARREFYANREFMSSHEEAQVAEMGAARGQEVKAQDKQTTAANLNRFLPDVGIGWSGAVPYLSVSLGRSNVEAFFQFSVQKLNNQASEHSYMSNQAAIYGTWLRRGEDWTHQEEQAELELAQIDQQIEAADLRIAIAEQELNSHEVQMQNAADVEAYLQSKYTHQELYNWMIGQISTVYFQSYQLAHDMAKQAERACQYELGLESTNLIQFGYWDSLKKGLLAGEKLQHDLRRLEASYLEEHKREFEMTKHISLSALDPEALLRLKEEGRCEIELPEALFDLDYPGHYCRRLKSVSLTIPAVTGPYTTLACTLRLLSSSIRRQSTLANVDDYARYTAQDDPRFSDRFGVIESIATSSGQNDSGVFELNFRDERYVPFEGAGAISRWQLEMPNDFRQFDYDSISDVVLHVRYTDKEAGGLLRDGANHHLNALLNAGSALGMHQAFSARREFATEFHRFLHAASELEPPTLMLNLAKNRFPYMLKQRDIRVEQAYVFVQFAEDILLSGTPLADVMAGTTLTLRHPGGTTSAVGLDSTLCFGNVCPVTFSVTSDPGEWMLELTDVGEGLTGAGNTLNPAAIEDIIVILRYTSPPAIVAT